MSTPPDPATQPDPGSAQPEPARPQQQTSWLARRRQQVAEEIARNRRGEYRVPTWVLTLILVAFVAVWVAVVAFA